MSSSLSNLSNPGTEPVPHAAGMRFGIVVSRWNTAITDALYQGCYDTLLGYGALPENIYTAEVPGSFELPVAARLLDAKRNPQALICLGCVIKGDTAHDEYINQAVASSLSQLSILRSKPFIFGVLTTNNEEQAQDRAGGKHGNKGIEAAITAIRMIDMSLSLDADKRKIGF